MATRERDNAQPAARGRSFEKEILAGGAWAYLRGRNMTKRVVALLGGMTLTWPVAAAEVALYLARSPRAPDLWSGEIS